MFSEDEIATLRLKCAHLISEGHLTRKLVDAALLDDPLLEKYTFIQIRTRLQYERSQIVSIFLDLQYIILSFYTAGKNSSIYRQ